MDDEILRTSARPEMPLEAFEKLRKACQRTLRFIGKNHRMDGNQDDESYDAVRLDLELSLARAEDAYLAWNDRASFLRFDGVPVKWQRAISAAKDDALWETALKIALEMRSEPTAEMMLGILAGVSVLKQA